MRFPIRSRSRFPFPCRSPNLYNERPAWLANAHRRLDEAVCAAYGWSADLSDDDLLARLLALNLERAGTSGIAGAIR